MIRPTVTPITHEIKVGDRVVFHSQWPWHLHYGRVTGEDLKYRNDAWSSREIAAWVVEWEGDLYFPERAGTVSCVPQYIALSAFHAVPEEGK